MNADFRVNRHLEELLEMCVLNGVTGFYPSAVSKYVHVPLSSSFDLLFRRTLSGELLLIWEVRCESLGCHNKISESEGKKIESEYFMCDKCGMEYELDEVLHIPRFDISKEYKNYILEEKNERKKKEQLLRI